MSNIFVSGYVFLTTWLTSGILFSTAVISAVVTKPLILGILLSV